LGRLHQTAVTVDSMHRYAIDGALYFGKCVWPICVATVLGGLLAGGIQSRFRTASEALAINWERLNPVQGLKRTFSLRSAVPTLLGILKLSLIIALSYGVV